MRRVGLAEQVNKKDGKYSRGMRQRLGLADVLIKNPGNHYSGRADIGYRSSGIQEFIELIRNLSRVHSLTVLFSSHNLDQVQKLVIVWAYLITENYWRSLILEKWKVNKWNLLISTIIM